MRLLGNGLCVRAALGSVSNRQNEAPYSEVVKMGEDSLWKMLSRLCVCGEPP